jgi:hypothetical protein
MVQDEVFQFFLWLLKGVDILSFKAELNVGKSDIFDDPRGAKKRKQTDFIDADEHRSINLMSLSSSKTSASDYGESENN